MLIMSTNENVSSTNYGKAKYNGASYEAAGKPGTIPSTYVRFYGGPWHGETRPDPRKRTLMMREWAEIARLGSELSLPAASATIKDTRYVRWESTDGDVLYIIEGLDPFAAGKPGQPTRKED